MTPPHKEFENRLLQIGGRRVIGHDDGDPDVPKLLQRGEVVPSQDVIMVAGEPNSCHANACRLHNAMPDIHVHTGWALSGDGIWRPHSWGYFPHTGQVVETTVSRDVYYGMRMQGDELEAFKMNNDY